MYIDADKMVDIIHSFYVGYRIEDMIYYIKKNASVNVKLNPLERNELEKAMLGRGVDYETIQLIMKDFDYRIEHLNNISNLKVCPVCGKIDGKNKNRVLIEG